MQPQLICNLCWKRIGPNTKLFANSDCNPSVHILCQNCVNHLGGHLIERQTLQNASSIGPSVRTQSQCLVEFNQMPADSQNCRESPFLERGLSALRPEGDRDGGRAMLISCNRSLSSISLCFPSRFGEGRTPWDVRGCPLKTKSVHRLQGVPVSWERTVQAAGPVHGPGWGWRQRYVDPQSPHFHQSLIQLEVHLLLIGDRRWSRYVVLRQEMRLLLPPLVVLWLRNTNWLHGITRAARIYIPVHWLPAILLTPKKILNDLPKFIRIKVINTLRSSLFLTTYQTNMKLTECYGRKLIDSDIPYLSMMGGIAAGTAILIEHPNRRSEIVLYVIPRAIEILLNLIPKRFDAISGHDLIPTVVFALSLAVWMGARQCEGVIPLKKQKKEKERKKNVCNDLNMTALSVLFGRFHWQWI